MPRSIDHNEVQRLLADGAQVVEVLPAKDFDEEHISGAVNIPLKELDDRAPSRATTERRSFDTCALGRT